MSCSYADLDDTLARGALAMIERGFTVKKIKNVWRMRNRYEDARAEAELFPLVFERSDDGLMPDDPHSQYPGVNMSVPPWI